MKKGLSNFMYSDPFVVLNNNVRIGLWNRYIIVVNVMPIIRERIIDSIILFFNVLILFCLYSLDTSGIIELDMADMKNDGISSTWIAYLLYIP